MAKIMRTQLIINLFILDYHFSHNYYIDNETIWIITKYFGKNSYFINPSYYK